MSQTSNQSVRETNRLAILKSARNLFKEKGYETVTIRDICEKSGVPRSSFYLMFSNKKDILKAMLDEVKVDFQTKINDFIQAPNDYERIWFLTASYLKVAEDFGPKLTRAVLDLDFDGENGLLDTIESFNGWLIALIGNAQKAGLIQNALEPHDLLQLQLAVSKGLLLDWVRSNGTFNLQKTVRAYFDKLLQIRQ